MTASVSVTLFVIFALSVAAELLIHNIPKSIRGTWSLLTLILIAALSAEIFFSSASVINVFILLICGYRALNVGRIIKSRMHAAYLRRATTRTTLWLVTVQSLLLITLLVQPVLVSYQDILLLLLSGMLLTVAIIFYNTVRRHTRQVPDTLDVISQSSSQLPAVTIAIPARNETDDLEACLQAAVASDYPKLEIIVLDDCSQNPRTPEIIRNFAHDGVRFINGREPASNWLAKNQAYQALAEAANGELIIFIGVDIRLKPSAVRNLVIYSIANSATMVSAVPGNLLTAASVPLLQPMRYFFELALPRPRSGYPAVLGSCWLIHKAALFKLGAFSAVPRMIIPEMYFARQLQSRGGYYLLANGGLHGIVSVKTLAAQRLTAIRTAYPRLRKRPELVAVTTSLSLLLVALPVSTLVLASQSEQYYIHAVLSGMAALVLATAYRQVLHIMYGNAGFISNVVFPVAALLELGLLHYSMFKYEFDEVIWKGRNVCIPAMHVVPTLPKDSFTADSEYK